MQGISLHYKYNMPMIKFVQVIGLLQLGIFVFYVVRFGSFLGSVFNLLIGVFFLGVPFLLKQGSLKNLQTSTMTGQEMHWQMDELTLSGTNSDTQFSRTWRSYYKALITPKGFLLYPQKNGLHWIPKTAFLTEEDFQKIKARIQANIPKCKVVS